MHHLISAFFVCKHLQLPQLDGFVYRLANKMQTGLHVWCDLTVFQFRLLQLSTFDHGYARVNKTQIATLATPCNFGFEFMVFEILSAGWCNFFTGLSCTRLTLIKPNSVPHPEQDVLTSKFSEYTRWIIWWSTLWWLGLLLKSKTKVCHCSGHIAEFVKLLSCVASCTSCIGIVIELFIFTAP